MEVAVPRNVLEEEVRRMAYEAGMLLKDELEKSGTVCAVVRESGSQFDSGTSSLEDS